MFRLFRISPLTRKALRDLWLMRGQALAIALVIAAGISMLVMSRSTLDSLRTTRDMLYAEQRFSHVWAHLKRAPVSLAQRVAEVPGVAEVDTRIVTLAKMQLPGFADPVQALVQSLPDGGEPPQNKLHMRAGRMLAAGARDEVLISDGFAKAHQLQPGAWLRLIVHGRAQWFRVAGVAVSAEHLVQIKHGAMFPDYERYAIVWVPKSALEAAMNMKGAFNQLVLRLADGAHEQDVIDATDRILQRYGGIGAVGRADQLSYRFLDKEFKQLATNAWLFPTIFLGVAAFLLNVVFKRLIGMQRDQIATLKAFGYTTREVALHYGQIVALISVLGVIVGVAAGVWLGGNLAQLYQRNFRFPYLTFALDVPVIAIGAGVSLLAALAGTGRAVLAAAREPVAQAMRPAAPESYRRTLAERLGLTRWLSQPARIVLRQIERHPFKALLTCVGLGLATSVAMLAGFQRASVNYLLAYEFGLVRQYDMYASFTEVTPVRALNELRALPGVLSVEGARAVPVRIGHLNHSYITNIEGLPMNGQMRRLLDRRGRDVPLPESGLVLGSWLAQSLGVQVGDAVWVEVMEGRQPRLTLPVMQLVDEYMGMNVYMNLPALNRTLGDDALITHVYMSVDPAQESALLHQLERRPQVMGAESQSAAVRSYRETMEIFMGIFATVATIMGAIINFGVVYNSARMSLSERARELASLRVLGMTRGEVTVILLGELALLTLLSLPLGAAFGWLMGLFLTGNMNNELFRVPLLPDVSIFAFAFFITCISALISALSVSWRVHRLDLVGALKTRE